MKRKLALSSVLFWALVGCSAAQTNHDTETSERSISRQQAKTTPFEHLKKKLTMKKGPTFLGFVQNSLMPAMKTFMPAYNEEEEQFPGKFSKWQTDWLESGEGTAVRIDSDNYFFNLGYRDGKRDDDPKSGRSYGVGPTKRQSDPSYPFYLGELEDYYNEHSAEIPKFLTALMKAIVNNDGSGWNGLSEEGQTVATDFLAIYAAESMRHNMVDLKPRKHQWEIDQAAVTFISAWVVQNGYMVNDEGKWEKASIKEFTQTGDNGGGVGMTHRQREQMTAAITEHLKDDPKAKAAKKKIESVTGELDDVIQGVFTFLNSPDSPEDLSDAKGEALVGGMVDYMKAILTIKDHKDVDL